MTTPHPYRILVTGSRNWIDTDAFNEALAAIVRPIPADREITVVHGDCPRGADALADEWARKYGATIERHPANWRPLGYLDRSAGFRRNAEMVRLGADICLAFIRNGSRGASHTAALAEQAGIPVKRWTA
jgi:SLOG family YspA-like protein